MVESNKEMIPVMDPFGAVSALAKLGQAWMNHFPEFVERFQALSGQAQDLALNEIKNACAAFNADNSEAGLPDGQNRYVVSMLKTMEDTVFKNMPRRDRVDASGALRLAAP